MTYDVAGPPDAPAIVFVHGTRLTRAVWAPQIRGLSGDVPDDRAWTCRATATLADEPFTLDGAADRVARRSIDEAADGRAVVVGLSLGGYVAMELAARSPERVRGLVLAGATAEPTGPSCCRTSRSRGSWAPLDGPRLDALNRRFFRSRFPAAIAEPIVAGGFWSIGGAAALRALAGDRFLPRLAAISGTDPDPQRRARPAVPPLGRSVRGGRAAAAPGPPGGRDAPLEPRSTGGLQRGRPPVRRARWRTIAEVPARGLT